MLFVLGCGDTARTSHPPTPRTPPCASESECAPGRCDPFQGCVECLFDTDCGEGERCRDRACEPVVSCKSDGDCPAGVCDPTLQQCVDCERDSDCTGPAHCVALRCEPFTPCKSDKDCAGGHCSTTLGECVACVNDGQCGSHEACKNNACITRCKNIVDCPAGDFCGNDGLCVQCLSHLDCPGVYHCAAGSCVLDVCEGASRCSSALDAVLTCSVAGDTLERAACASNQSCVAASAGALCHARNCMPGRWACDATGRYTELCAADGIALAERRDCTESSQVCNAGSCVAQSCEPGRVHCGPAGVMRCDTVGAAESLIEACSKNQFCDPNALACVDHVCAPNALSCVGDVVVACDGMGAALELLADCASMQELCWQGACLPRACRDPFVCVDGDSYACEDNSTRLALATQCGGSAQTHCDDATGTCQANLCEPGGPTCNGEFVTSCNADGSAPNPGGIDCTATGRVCWAGDCLPSICSDPFECKTEALYRCANHGTALVLEKSCPAGTVCDATTGACRSQDCEPNQPACDGNVATQCTASGRGYTGPRTDCAPTGLVCVGGECLPVICTPDAIYCDGSEVRKCDPSGAMFALLDSCSPAEHCSPGQPVCLPNVCAPGTPICDGAKATTCLTDGSGPAPDGTNCTLTQQACERGVCKDLVCAPEQLLCQAGVKDLLRCNSLGTATAPFQTCTAGEHCDGLATPAACAPNLCTPNKNACKGERRAVCNADGSGYSILLADCAASSTVCDLAGSCAASATDELSVSATGGGDASSAFRFLVFHALTTRRLSSLELGLSFQAGSTLTWLAYEADQAVGPYSPVAQSVVSGVSASANAALVTSGPFQVSIAAGKYYLLGVGIPGANSWYGNSALATPVPLSFGQVLGSFSYFPLASMSPPLAGPSSIQVDVSALGGALWARLTSAPP